MGLENELPHHKERLSENAIVLQPQEQEPFRVAISRFIKQSSYTIPASFSSELVLSSEIKAGKDTVHVSPVTLDLKGDEETTQHIETGNKLFNILLNTAITPRMRDGIIQYLKSTDSQGRSRNQILMFRYNQPSKAFQQRLRSHTARHHRNLAPATEILLSQSLIMDKSKSRKASVEQIDEEQHSLQNLQKEASESIRFVAITPIGTSKSPPNYIAQVLDRMNRAADPYEFMYDVFATFAKQQRKQAWLSGGFIVGGAASGFGFGPMAKEVGQTTTDVFSQAAGEAITIGLSGSDRLLNKVRKISDMHEESLPQDEPKKISKTPLIARGVVFAANVAVATGASILSQKTNNPLWITGIAPFNTTLIDGVELYERAAHGRELGKTPKYEQLVERYALQESGPIARHLFKNHPHMAFSLVDFKRYNPAATATLVGTYVSAGSLAEAIHLYPHMPRAWLLALSGIIIENAFGVFGAIKGIRKNPWNEFTNTLSDLEIIESH